ncbi:MAG: hypothetical protein R3338_15495, partial [Thermoanaerobaculia bacterium]|nr:hypothetical protein [Thermoanaerobaculia bacterium]
DVNDDNIIDEQEWTLGTERWAFDDIDWGEWDTWDANADAELTETEWNEEWNSTVWPSWGVETDGVVGRDELADTFWDFFDANDDDIIDAGEWEPQG